MVAFGKSVVDIFPWTRRSAVTHSVHVLEKTSSKIRPMENVNLRFLRTAPLCDTDTKTFSMQSAVLFCANFWRSDGIGTFTVHISPGTTCIRERGRVVVAGFFDDSGTCLYINRAYATWRRPSAYKAAQSVGRGGSCRDECVLVDLHHRLLRHRWLRPLVFPEFFAGHDPTGGSGHEVFKISRVESGQVSIHQNVRGSGRGSAGPARPDPTREV